MTDCPTAYWDCSGTNCGGEDVTKNGMFIDNQILKSITFFFFTVEWNIPYSQGAAVPISMLQHTLFVILSLWP
jgi:hypothetical protein